MVRLILIVGIITAFSSCDVKSDVADKTANKEQCVQEVYKFSEGEHIHWEANYDYINEELVFKVSLAPGWKTYSTYNNNFMGPLPTLVDIESSEKFQLLGEIVETDLKTIFDKEAKSDLKYFEQYGELRQKIKINSGEKFAVEGYINYMTCDAHSCEPPKDFNFNITIEPK